MRFKSYPMKIIYSLRCIYCGDLADTVDHILPRSLYNKKLLTIPACRECNSIINNRIFDTFLERCSFIKSKLSAKYPKKIGLSNKDLEELEGDLKDLILNRIEYEKFLESRLNWQETIEFKELYSELFSKIHILTSDPNYLELFPHGKDLRF